MNDYKNFCEYAYAPEAGGKGVATRIILLTGYTLFTLIYFVIFGLILPSTALLIMLPFIVIAIIRITWKYVNKEYEILIEAGEMTVAVIYGGVKRRTKKRVYIPEMTLIARYTKERAAMIKNGRIDEVADFSASSDSEDSFICVYPDTKRGKKHAVIIETNDEMRRVLHLCNPTAFERN